MIFFISNNINPNNFSKVNHNLNIKKYWTNLVWISLVYFLNYVCSFLFKNKIKNA